LTSGTVPLTQLPIATTSALGLVQPDGTTITISDGILSAVSGGDVALASNVVSGIDITNAFLIDAFITNSVLSDALITNSIISSSSFAGDGGGLTNLNGVNIASASVTPDKLSPTFGSFFCYPEKQPIYSGEALEFEDSGLSSGLFYDEDYGVILQAAGIYEVSWQITVNGPCQTELELNGEAQLQTIVGHGSGSSQLVGNVIIQTYSDDTELQVINPFGNNTFTVIGNPGTTAGGNQYLYGSLVIKRLQ
jgi:hypothetical protein